MLLLLASIHCRSLTLLDSKSMMMAMSGVSSDDWSNRVKVSKSPATDSHTRCFRPKHNRPRKNDTWVGQPSMSDHAARAHRVEALATNTALLGSCEAGLLGNGETTVPVTCVESV